MALLNWKRSMTIAEMMRAQLNNTTKEDYLSIFEWKQQTKIFPRSVFE